MNKKADMGIGTLILFIAMILVAAIAAGVLIQTATSLQNKALLTGERSKSQVSTNLMPIILHGEDGSSNNSVDRFYLKTKLSPGSDPINFDDLLLDFSLKNLTLNLIYNSTKNCSDDSSLSSTEFHVDYLIQGESYSKGYFQSGDMVLICFKSSRDVLEDESVKLSLVPKVGSPTTIEAAIPDIVTEMRVVIFP
jgi:archaeal flagellin FlaB